MHAPSAPPSIEQVTLATPDASATVKLTAVVDPTVAPSDGAAIEIDGPVLSTTKLRETGGAPLPWLSIAVTVTVCSPSANPPYVTGETHDPVGPLSIEQLMLATPDGSEAVKMTVTVDPKVAPADGEVIETVGPLVSTTKPLETVVTLPALSVAVTVTVCGPSASPV